MPRGPRWPLSKLERRSYPQFRLRPRHLYHLQARTHTRSVPSATETAMANSLEAKIVVLGSQGVGKTSLVHRYVKNAFTPPTTQSTIGASFLTKRVVDIDTSTVVRLQIWDTAGQERFRSISKLYYRGTFAVTLRHAQYKDPILSRYCFELSFVLYFCITISALGRYPSTCGSVGNRGQSWTLARNDCDCLLQCLRC